NGFAQSEAERDGEERVSHPVVGADDEDPPQSLAAGKAALHPERTPGHAGERSRKESGRSVEARIGHAIAASQASRTRCTSRSRRHLWWPSGQRGWPCALHGEHESPSETGRLRSAKTCRPGAVGPKSTTVGVPRARAAWTRP